MAAAIRARPVRAMPEQAANRRNDESRFSEARLIAMKSGPSTRCYLISLRAGVFFFATFVGASCASSFHASRSFGFLSMRSSNCSPRGFLCLVDGTFFLLLIVLAGFGIRKIHRQIKRAMRFIVSALSACRVRCKSTVIVPIRRESPCGVVRQYSAEGCYLSIPLLRTSSFWRS